MTLYETIFTRRQVRNYLNYVQSMGLGSGYFMNIKPKSETERSVLPLPLAGLIPLPEPVNPSLNENP